MAITRLNGSSRRTVSVLGLCCLITLGNTRPSSSLRQGHTCPSKWQDEYARLHRSILDGSAAPQDRRFAISISSPAGLADRLAGCVTVFYYALLTGRAFLEHTAIPGQIPLKAAFHAPNIDWVTDKDYNGMLPSLKPGDLGLSSAKGEEFQHFNLLNPEGDEERDEIFKLFSSGNLSNLAKNIESTFITTNRGASVRLFDNPFHKDQLRKMGLSPETAFGCALHFLFNPVSEVMKLVRPSMHLLDRGPSIGIHIRVGDHVLHGADVEHIDKFDNFFDCAKQVELAYFPRAQKVTWLVFSDSKIVRKQATEVYGEKVQTLFTEKVEHSFGGQGNEVPYASLDGFWAAVAEHWILGFTDVQIIDKSSGFGSTAAMRTFRTDHVFMVGHGESVLCHRGQGIAVMDIGRFRAGAK